MGKRGGKKKPSKSKLKAGNKVGIVCHSVGEDGDYEIKLYLVDIDNESRPVNIDNESRRPVEEYGAATPAVQFIIPAGTRSTHHGICILKSVVYLFAGHNHLTRDRPSSEIPKKYAKKFVLSAELDKGNYKVKVAELSGIPDMNYPKFSPTALPIPGGKKILVFGANVVVRKPYEAFELYDPQLKEWEKIPGLPLKCECQYDPGLLSKCTCCYDGFGKRQQCSCSYWIYSYGFVGKSHFLVEIEIGTFALNLTDKKWFEVRVPKIPGGGYFLTVEDRYVLTPKKAYNLYDGAGFLLEEGTAGDSDDFIHGPPFPLSTFAPPNTPKWLRLFSIPSIVPVRPFVMDGGVYKTCVLQLEVAEQGPEARVLIDVCRTDLATLETIVSKCVSLRVDFYDHLHAMILISV